MMNYVSKYCTSFVTIGFIWSRRSQHLQLHLLPDSLRYCLWHLKLNSRRNSSESCPCGCDLVESITRRTTKSRPFVSDHVPTLRRQVLVPYLDKCVEQLRRLQAEDHLTIAGEQLLKSVTSVLESTPEMGIHRI